MDSTSTLDLLSSAQSGKEVTANDYFNASSLAAMFANKALSTSGLTWGMYGVPRVHINATATVKANDALSITASSTRFLSISRALTPTEVATAFAADKFALYRIVTGTSTITSYEDHRDWHHLNRFLYGHITKAMSDANQTLTYQEAMCESIETTGALTALRDLIVPLVPRHYMIYANNTGGFGVRVIGASGTGIIVGDGKRAIVQCNGTNVLMMQTNQDTQDIAFAASITPNAAAGERIIVGTLTGNITINAPTLPSKGARLVFAFLQDGTGSRTLTWNAAFKKGTDVLGAANQRATIGFVYDGTNWIADGTGIVTWFT